VRPVSISSSLGGRSCARRLSRTAASRPRRSLPSLRGRRPAARTPIGIPSRADDVVVPSRNANQALLLRPQCDERAG
jgi:hypothetical protein